MPPPKKIDLIPAEFREWLTKALEKAGYGNIVEITEDLNTMLATAGVELRLGKSAVGAYAKVQKDQREAHAISKAILSGGDLESESDLHTALHHALTANALRFVRQIAEDDDPMGPQALSHMARFMKDSMASVGIREKLLEDERQRVRKEAQEEERKAQEEKLDHAAAAGQINKQAHAAARAVLGFG